MSQKKIIEKTVPCRRLGTGQKHHFFGYYNKTVWDRSGRYLLANQVPVMDANLVPDLVADVGFFDLQDSNKYHLLDQTTAWNWQMGCQLQWLDGAEGRRIIYNTRTSSPNPADIYPGFNAIIYDIDTDTKTTLPLPIYVVAPNSQYALCVDYTRLWVTHETIGYCEETPRKLLAPAPADDGIYYLDLKTGASTLLLSYQDLREFHPVKSMENAIHWVSHLEINPSSSRFLLLHRWTERVKDETCFLHRLITVNPDGTDMRLLECSDHPLPQLADDFDPTAVGTFDYEKSEYQISHPLWRDDNHIIVWSPHDGSIHYHLYHDNENGKVAVIGPDVLTENGHMTYSPVNKRWLLSDTYPDSDTNERILFLFDVDNQVRYDLGSFFTDPALKKENRCDLHPRWSRDGKQICIDSVHESERQMYVIDVSEITEVVL